MSKPARTTQRYLDADGRTLRYFWISDLLGMPPDPNPFPPLRLWSRRRAA